MLNIEFFRALHDPIFSSDGTRTCNKFAELDAVLRPVLLRASRARRWAGLTNCVVVTCDDDYEATLVQKWALRRKQSEGKPGFRVRGTSRSGANVKLYVEPTRKKV